MTEAIEHRGYVPLPPFSGLRIMHMPIVLGDPRSARRAVHDAWEPYLGALMDLAPQHHGKVGYITIDERVVGAGETHRRAGIHVDGVFEGKCGGWGGDGGGSWGSKATGMLTTSNVTGCRAWDWLADTFDDDGGCEHLRGILGDGDVLEPDGVYWLHGLTVHESLPQPVEVERQFVRLSLPSTAPWFEGYTENPNGVQPTGPTLPRRWQMDS